MSSSIDRKRIEEVLRLVSTTLAASQLYSVSHEQVRTLVPRIVQSLKFLFYHQPELTFMVVRKELLFQGQPLERTPHSERIARQLHARKIGYFSFRDGIDEAQIVTFLEVAAGNLSVHHFDTCDHIGYGILDVKEDPTLPLAIARFEDLTKEELQSIEDLYTRIGNKDKFDISGVASVVSGFVSAMQQESNPLLALVPLKMEDDYSFTHSLNVAILNIAQGLSLGLSEDLLHDVGLAGMLHDAGKVFVDKEIISSPGQLSDQEWEQMQQHPMRGAQYLMGQQGIPQLAILAAFEHHMRYDLKGYPPPPADWTLNICSQMTMISDTFDALRTRRSYKEPWDFPAICGRMLEVSGSQLNPYLTMNFLKVLEKSGRELIEEGIELAADVPILSEEQLAKRCVCE